MGGQKFSEEFEIKVSAKRLWWACVKDGHNFAVKCVPHTMAKAVNESESFGEVGTVRTIHFHKGVHRFDSITAKVVEVDEEKLLLKMVFVDGNHEGTLSNNYKVTMHFTEGLMKYSIEFDGPRELFYLEDVKEFMYHTLRGMEAVLLANEHEYKEHA